MLKKYFILKVYFLITSFSLLLLLPVSAWAQCSPATTGSNPYTVTFTAAGACTWTVPCGVTAVTVTCYGANGTYCGADMNGSAVVSITPLPTPPSINTITNL